MKREFISILSLSGALLASPSVFGEQQTEPLVLGVPVKTLRNIVKTMEMIQSGKVDPNNPPAANNTSATPTSTPNNIDPSVTGGDNSVPPPPAAKPAPGSTPPKKIIAGQKPGDPPPTSGDVFDGIGNIKLKKVNKNEDNPAQKPPQETPMNHLDLIKNGQYQLGKSKHYVLPKDSPKEKFADYLLKKFDPAPNTSDDSADQQSSEGKGFEKILSQSTQTSEEVDGGKTIKFNHPNGMQTTVTINLKNKTVRVEIMFPDGIQVTCATKAMVTTGIKTKGILTAVKTKNLEPNDDWVKDAEDEHTRALGELDKQIETVLGNNEELKQFETAMAPFKTALDGAKRKLTDAEQKLANANKALSNANQDLQWAGKDNAAEKAEVKAAQAEVDEAQKVANDAQTKFNDAQKKFDDKNKEEPEIGKILRAAQESIKELIDKWEPDENDGDGAFRLNEDQLKAHKKNLEAAKERLDKEKDKNLIKALDERIEWIDDAIDDDDMHL